MHIALTLILAVLLTGCASSSKFDGLTESQKGDVAKADAAIQELAACAKTVQGNDAAFTQKCAKLLENRPLRAMFFRARAGLLQYDVTLWPTPNSVVSCHYKNNKGDDAKLAALKEGDWVSVSGFVSSYVLSERKSVNLHQLGKSPFTYRIDFQPCKLSFD